VTDPAGSLAEVGGAGRSCVAVVGAGSIGVAWALVFARAGHPVVVQDPDPARLTSAPEELRTRLLALDAHGLLDEPVDVVGGRVAATADVTEAVAAAVHVQECAPEDVDLKRRLFAQLDGLAPPDAVLASSSSALTCSSFAADVVGRRRCLVVHPGNPPYLLPVAELVPAPFTAPEVVDRTDALLSAVGMSVVRVEREVEGFVFNRLQGALLREAYCLVRDGVVTADDLDRVVRDGLGRRWAVLGPFATAELNTRGGIETHAARLGAAYARMGAERGQADPWSDTLVELVATQLHRVLPPDQWEDQVLLRDARLMVLERARRDSALFPADDRHGKA